MNKRKDLTGQRFGRLVVLDYSHSDRHGQTYWRCVDMQDFEEYFKGVDLGA